MSANKPFSLNLTTSTKNSIGIGATFSTIGSLISRTTEHIISPIQRAVEVGSDIFHRYGFNHTSDGYDQLNRVWRTPRQSEDIERKPINSNNFSLFHTPLANPNDVTKPRPETTVENLPMTRAMARTENLVAPQAESYKAWEATNQTQKSDASLEAILRWLPKSNPIQAQDPMTRNNAFTEYTQRNQMFAPLEEKTADFENQLRTFRTNNRENTPIAESDKKQTEQSSSNVETAAPLAQNPVARYWDFARTASRNQAFAPITTLNPVETQAGFGNAPLQNSGQSAQVERQADFGNTLLQRAEWNGAKVEAQRSNRVEPQASFGDAPLQRALRTPRRKETVQPEIRNEVKRNYEADNVENVQDSSPEPVSRVYEQYISQLTQPEPISRIYDAPDSSVNRGYDSVASNAVETMNPTSNRVHRAAEPSVDRAYASEAISTNVERASAVSYDAPIHRAFEQVNEPISRSYNIFGANAETTQNPLARHWNFTQSAVERQGFDAQAELNQPVLAVAQTASPILRQFNQAGGVLAQAKAAIGNNQAELNYNQTAAQPETKVHASEYTAPSMETAASSSPVSSIARAFEQAHDANFEGVTAFAPISLNRDPILRNEIFAFQANNRAQMFAPIEAPKSIETQGLTGELNPTNEVSRRVLRATPEQLGPSEKSANSDNKGQSFFSANNFLAAFATPEIQERVRQAQLEANIRATEAAAVDENLSPAARRLAERQMQKDRGTKVQPQAETAQFNDNNWGGWARGEKRSQAALPEHPVSRYWSFAQSAIGNKDFAPISNNSPIEPQAGFGRKLNQLSLRGMTNQTQRKETPSLQTALQREADAKVSATKNANKAHAAEYVEPTVETDSFFASEAASYEQPVTVNNAIGQSILSRNFDTAQAEPINSFFASDPIMRAYELSNPFAEPKTLGLFSRNLETTTTEPVNRAFASDPIARTHETSPAFAEPKANGSLASNRVEEAYAPIARTLKARPQLTSDVKESAVTRAFSPEQSYQELLQREVVAAEIEQNPLARNWSFVQQAVQNQAFAPVSGLASVETTPEVARQTAPDDAVVSPTNNPFSPLERVWSGLQTKSAMTQRQVSPTESFQSTYAVEQPSIAEGIYRTYNVDTNEAVAKNAIGQTTSNTQPIFRTADATTQQPSFDTANSSQAVFRTAQTGLAQPNNMHWLSPQQMLASQASLVNRAEQHLANNASNSITAAPLFRAIGRNANSSAGFEGTTAVEASYNPTSKVLRQPTLKAATEALSRKANDSKQIAYEATDDASDLQGASDVARDIATGNVQRANLETNTIGDNVVSSESPRYQAGEVARNYETAKPSVAHQSDFEADTVNYRGGGLQASRWSESLPALRNNPGTISSPEISRQADDFATTNNFATEVNTFSPVARATVAKFQPESLASWSAFTNWQNNEQTTQRETAQSIYRAEQVPSQIQRASSVETGLNGRVAGSDNNATETNSWASPQMTWGTRRAPAKPSIPELKGAAADVEVTPLANPNQVSNKPSLIGQTQDVDRLASTQADANVGYEGGQSDFVYRQVADGYTSEATPSDTWQSQANLSPISRAFARSVVAAPQIAQVSAPQNTDVVQNQAESGLALSPISRALAQGKVAKEAQKLGYESAIAGQSPAVTPLTRSLAYNEMAGVQISRVFGQEQASPAIERDVTPISRTFTQGRSRRDAAQNQASVESLSPLARLLSQEPVAEVSPLARLSAQTETASEPLSRLVAPSENEPLARLIAPSEKPASPNQETAKTVPALERTLARGRRPQGQKPQAYQTEAQKAEEALSLRNERLQATAKPVSLVEQAQNLLRTHTSESVTPLATQEAQPSLSPLSRAIAQSSLVASEQTAIASTSWEAKLAKLIGAGTDKMASSEQTPAASQDQSPLARILAHNKQGVGPNKLGKNSLAPVYEEKPEDTSGVKEILAAGTNLSPMSRALSRNVDEVSIIDMAQRTDTGSNEALPLNYAPPLFLLRRITNNNDARPMPVARQAEANALLGFDPAIEATPIRVPGTGLDSVREAIPEFGMLDSKAKPQQNPTEAKPESIDPDRWSKMLPTLRQPILAKLVDNTKKPTAVEQAANERHNDFVADATAPRVHEAQPQPFNSPAVLESNITPVSGFEQIGVDYSELSSAARLMQIHRQRRLGSKTDKPVSKELDFATPTVERVAETSLQAAEPIAMTHVEPKPIKKDVSVHSEGIAVTDNVLSESVGQKLDSWVQTKMNKIFGKKFEEVKVHTDIHAAKFVEQVDPGAEAFTHRNHIFFAPGRYQPNSTEGMALIGHEITHMLQGVSLPSLGGKVMSGISSLAESHEHQAIQTERLIKQGINTGGGTLHRLVQSHLHGLPTNNSVARQEDEDESENSQDTASMSSEDNSSMADTNSGGGEGEGFEATAQSHLHPAENLKKMISSGSGFAKQLLGGMLGKNKATGASSNQAGGKSQQAKKSDLDIDGHVQVALRNFLDEMNQRSQWDAQRTGHTGRSDTLDFG